MYILRIYIEFRYPNLLDNKNNKVKVFRDKQESMIGKKVIEHLGYY